MFISFGDGGEGKVGASVLQKYWYKNCHRFTLGSILSCRLQKVGQLTHTITKSMFIVFADNAIRRNTEVGFKILCAFFSDFTNYLYNFVVLINPVIFIILFLYAFFWLFCRLLMA